MSGRFLFAILLVFVACKKKESYETVSVIGHAGNGLHISNSIYHDNSREAIELALSTEGCDGVEVDVQLSKDHRLWLYHDPGLATETTGSSCINSKGSEELKKVRYRSFSQERLVKLITLDKNLLNGKTIFLDTRHFNECEQKDVDFSKMLAALHQFHKIYHATTIYVLTNYEPWVKLLSKEGFKLIFSAETLSLAASIALDQVEGFMFKNDEISENEVSDYRSKNKKIIIFEVRSPKGIRSALKKRPDYLVSDDIRTTLIEKYP